MSCYSQSDVLIFSLFVTGFRLFGKCWLSSPPFPRPLLCRVPSVNENGLPGHPPAIRNQATDDGYNVLGRLQDRLLENLASRIERLIVAPALPEFLDRYPGLDIELDMTDRSINLAEDWTNCVLRSGLCRILA